MSGPRATPPAAAAARKASERELRRLHFINTLFSHITGHDLYLAAQIKAAISFSLEELVTKNAAQAKGATSCEAGQGAAAANHIGAGTGKHVASKAAATTPLNHAAATSCDAPFHEAAARLLQSAFARHYPQRGFYHWDAAQSLASATPLFARDEILLGLRQLAPYRESTLLITNLRPALIPPPKRATTRRVTEYRDLVDFIRQLTAAHSSPGAALQLLFL